MGIGGGVQLRLILIVESGFFPLTGSGVRSSSPRTLATAVAEKSSSVSINSMRPATPKNILRAGERSNDGFSFIEAPASAERSSLANAEWSIDSKT